MSPAGIWIDYLWGMWSEKPQQVILIDHLEVWQTRGYTKRQLKHFNEEKVVGARAKGVY